MPNNSKQSFSVRPMGHCKRLEAISDQRASWKRFGDGRQIATIDVRLPTEINLQITEVAFAGYGDKRDSSKTTYAALDLKTSRALYELLKEFFEGEGA